MGIKGLAVMILMLSINLAFGQDEYHTELLTFLEDNYQIKSEEFVLYDNELENLESMYLYGNAERSIKEVEGFDFTQILSLDVLATGNNAWDAGNGLANVRSIQSGDVVLVTFWARSVSNQTEVTFFCEDSDSFEKEVSVSISFTPDWTRYFMAFQSSSTYQPTQLTIGFHLASLVQSFEIAGFTALNFGDIDTQDVPSTISSSNYGGYEADAPWREEAASRINQIRKKDLVIQVVDASGTPVQGAKVDLIMQEHHFQFGSALVGCRFPDNNCYNQTYLEKITNLDGEGHGFNAAVTENALKWDGWEEQWIGSPEETVSAIKYLHDQGIPIRGHTLIWPGWTHLPSDMEQNQTDIAYLRGRMEDRLEEMLIMHGLDTLIDEWDVLNEITQVRDLEQAFAHDPDYATGREIYPEILRKTKELHPELKAYINDYVVLSGGGSGTSVVERYKSYLDEIVASGAPFEGIGFQAHIGSQPNSIYQVQEVLDEFSEAYQKRIKITEYDINPTVDEETQAHYLRDFLTIVFSHPSVDAFLMWGFWDGNHWKGNAPIFNQDWTIKPSGQAFIDLVFNRWWTDTTSVTNQDGITTFRPFRGRHLASVTLDDETRHYDVDTEVIDTLRAELGTTSSTEHSFDESYRIAPNPASQEITISHTHSSSTVDVRLFTAQGQILWEKDCTPGQPLRLEVAPGLYYISIERDGKKQISKLMVHP